MTSGQEEAIQFVDHVLVRKTVASIEKKNDVNSLGITLVASKDDMVRLVERMLEKKSQV
jgi:hypothetical protein